MSVLIYAENWDGKFKKQTFELVSYGAGVAKMTGSELNIISIGSVAETDLAELGKYGAGKVLNANADGLKSLDNQVYADIIGKAAQETGAGVIIMANNNTGKALAPRLSVKLKAGVGAGVNQLPDSIEPFTVRKRVYSGNAFARVVIKSDISILTLNQNSFGITETGGTAIIETFSVDGVAEPKTVVTDVQKQEGKLLLTDAEIVVSGGRGMKSAENWGPLEELAKELGAATACSRPVSDEGWRPHEEHTGQTGKIIAPNLYIAVGISGATQHIAGVSASKYIVGINNDKDAPIFENAQYGIVGDAAKILPRLVEAVKETHNK